MHDFELFAVGHPGAKQGHVSEDGSGESSLPVVSGATKVDFDSFLMARVTRPSKKTNPPPDPFPRTS